MHTKKTVLVFENSRLIIHFLMSKEREVWKIKKMLTKMCTKDWLSVFLPRRKYDNTNNIIYLMKKIWFTKLYGLLQIRSSSTDQGSVRRCRDLRPSNHILQRHRGLHQSIRTVYAPAGSGPTQRSLHLFRFHHWKLRCVQGKNEILNYWITILINSENLNHKSSILLWLWFS